MSTSKSAADNPLDNVSMILVGTLQAGNIGSAARAMKNMGLTRLKLVSPRRRMNEECRRMAGKALDLVENAEIFDSFDEAVQEEAVLAATTSARDRRQRLPLATPREAAQILMGHARSQRVGVVFGPERSGLSEEQLARCQLMVSIPANPEYPVLNLAQSVLLLAYELGSLSNALPGRAEAAASQALRQEMFGQVQETLIRIGFLSSSSPESIMNSIRGILDRPGLSPREVRIVRGIMSHMQWYVEEGWKLGPEKVRKP